MYLVFVVVIGTLYPCVRTATPMFVQFGAYWNLMMTGADIDIGVGPERLSMCNNTRMYTIDRRNCFVNLI